MPPPPPNRLGTDDDDAGGADGAGVEPKPKPPDELPLSPPPNNVGMDDVDDGAGADELPNRLGIDDEVGAAAGAEVPNKLGMLDEAGAAAGAEDDAPNKFGIPLLDEVVVVAGGAEKPANVVVVSELPVPNNDGIDAAADGDTDVADNGGMVPNDRVGADDAADDVVDLSVDKVVGKVVAPKPANNDEEEEDVDAADEVDVVADVVDAPNNSFDNENDGAASFGFDNDDNVSVLVNGTNEPNEGGALLGAALDVAKLNNDDDDAAGAAGLSLSSSSFSMVPIPSVASSFSVFSLFLPAENEPNENEKPPADGAAGAEVLKLNGVIEVVVLVRSPNPPSELPNPVDVVAFLSSFSLALSSLFIN